VPTHLDSRNKTGRYSLVNSIFNVERAVSDSCVIAQSNGVSADIVRSAKFANNQEERYHKEDPTLGCWLASGDAGGLCVRRREERERENAMERV
jgi:hypothetical protein